MSITFNGTNGNTLGCIVERYPDRPFPERLVDSVRVPGRNGNLTRKQGYANVALSYEVYFSGEGSSMQTVADAVAAWLLSPSGYCRLEDSYDTTVYRMAQYIGPVDVRNYINKFGRVTLNFDAMPQRWLKTGETPVAHVDGDVITNDTTEVALPIIQLTGSGDVTISLGGATLDITGLSGDMTIDCDTQNCYDGVTNLNGIVTRTNGFPSLQPGANTLAIGGTGTVSALTVTPRWWVP